MLAASVTDDTGSLENADDSVANAAAEVLEIFQHISIGVWAPVIIVDKAPLAGDEPLAPTQLETWVVKDNKLLTFLKSERCTH